MSISSIQKEKAFSKIARRLFSKGEQPRLVDIMKDVSEHFSKHPIGVPLEYDPTYLGDGSKSDPVRFNTQLQTTLENLDVLYEASFEQVQSVMSLSSILRTELDRLDTRRKKLISKIDDYLFSLYNTDGYYFSVSDTFSDLSLVDTRLSSAVVDTQSGGVMIPSGSAGTKYLNYSEIGSANINCVTSTNATVNFDNLSDFGNAIDGLSNTAWIIDLDRDTPEPITCVLLLTMANIDNPPRISKLEFDPYGVSAVQLFIEAISPADPVENRSFEQFGNAIKTSTDRMVFVDHSRPVEQLRLTLIKHTPDYVIESAGKVIYRYVFGAKEIGISEYFYDRSATIVSQPLEIDGSLINDHVIDAVSLTANVDTPSDAKISFYVASNLSDTSPDLTDFDWKPINLVSQLSQQSDVFVDFNGARNFARFIKSDPDSADLQLIAPDTTNEDLQKRNPTSIIVPGVDIYRIARFEDTPLPKSVLLEEGVNTVKIYHITRNSAAINDLAFWKPYLDGSSTPTITYGHIDSSNDFFYGGDVGQNGRSVYVETYLESLNDQPLVIKSCRKADPNSKQWAVKVYLNGRQLAYMPVGTDEFLIPWAFKRGLNHIAVVIDIPLATDIYPNVYIGALDLMGDSNLYDFGTVKLANWDYVDLFNLQYNQVGEPKVFTIYNDEIISRRKPTSNFRVKYSKASDQAPTAIRLRADLERAESNPNVTPILKSYRLRFLYGDR